MIGAIREPAGPVASDDLSWHLEGADDVDHVTLERRDGSQVIALWRPVSVWDIDARQPVDPGTARVRLSFDSSKPRDLVVWRPSVSSQPVLRRDDATDLGLSLAGDLVLVSVR